MNQYNIRTKMPQDDRVIMNPWDYRDPKPFLIAIKNVLYKAPPQDYWFQEEDHYWVSLGELSPL